MKTSRYYIFANDRWFELDTQTGRVNGWRNRVMFAYSHNGKLEIGRTKRVLKALRAHASGQKSSIRDAQRLNYQRPKKKKKWKGTRTLCRQHCCHRQADANPEPNRCVSEECKTGDSIKTAALPFHNVEIDSVSNKKDSNAQTSKGKNDYAEDLVDEESDSDESTNQQKELIIDGEDVALLRSFLAKNLANVDLNQFDNDEDYRKEVFYRINPLVVLEKNREIIKMIRLMKEREERRLSVVEFAKKLGLKSINTMKANAVDSDNRCKVNFGVNDRKKSKAHNNKDSDAVKLKQKKKTIDKTGANSKRYIEKTDVINSNNAKVGKANAKASNKNVRSSPRLKCQTEISTNPITRSSPRKKQLSYNYDLTSDDDLDITHNRKMNHTHQPMQKEKQNPSNNSYISLINTENNNIIIKRVDDKNKTGKIQLRTKTRVDRRYGHMHKEYSSEEDKAIVTWVSADTARARMVNGNRLWRQMERPFKNITGRERSWHSLRNRYLRYLLPELDRLDMPPEKASLLRVGAARGEMKSRIKRRNSMFVRPAVKSASARAHGLNKENTSLKRNKSPQPTYSEILRAYNQRHTRSCVSPNQAQNSADKLNSIENYITTSKNKPESATNALKLRSNKGFDGTKVISAQTAGYTNSSDNGDYESSHVRTKRLSKNNPSKKHDGKSKVLESNITDLYSNKSINIQHNSTKNRSNNNQQQRKHSSSHIIYESDDSDYSNASENNRAIKKNEKFHKKNNDNQMWAQNDTDSDRDFEASSPKATRKLRDSTRKAKKSDIDKQSVPNEVNKESGKGSDAPKRRRLYNPKSSK